MHNVPATCAQYAYCLISIIRNLVEETLMMGSQEIDAAFQRFKIHNQIKVHQRLNVVVSRQQYTKIILIISCTFIQAPLSSFHVPNFLKKMHLRTHVYTCQYYGLCISIMLGMYYVVQALEIKNFKNSKLDDIKNL